MSGVCPSRFVRLFRETSCVYGHGSRAHDRGDANRVGQASRLSHHPPLDRQDACPALPVPPDLRVAQVNRGGRSSLQPGNVSQVECLTQRAQMIQPRWGRIFVGCVTQGSARRATLGLSDEILSGFPAATVAGDDLLQRVHSFRGGSRLPGAIAFDHGDNPLNSRKNQIPPLNNSVRPGTS